MPKVTFDRPIAHRGLHNRAAGVIENTASAFEAAVAGNFTIECDVQLSSDGVPVVFHDDDLERLTGAKGLLSARPVAELQTLKLLDSAAGDTPQRFTEFLEQIAGRTLLQIELKRQEAGSTEALAQRCVEALASYRGPMTVESFDPNLLIAVRKFGYKGPLGIITYGYDEPTWDADIPPRQRYILRHLLHWPATRFDFISCRHLSLDLPAVKFFRSTGMPVTAWTVKTVAEASAALAHSDQIVFEGFDPAAIPAAA